MAKIKKIAAAAAVAAAISLSTLCIGASANNVSNSYCSFKWDENGAKLTNKTNTIRLMTATCDVYEDNTGKYVKSYYSSNVGSYDTYAFAENTSYPMNRYNLVCSGGLYKASVEYSGKLCEFKDKVYD